MSEDNPFESVVNNGQAASSDNSAVPSSANSGGGDNPFNSVVDQHTPESSYPGGSSSSLLDSMNNEFDKAATGVMQKVVGVNKWLADKMGMTEDSKASQDYLDKIDAYRADKQANADAAYNAHPLASNVGSVLGILGRSIAYGGTAGVGKTLAGTVLGNAAVGGAQTALDYSQPGETPKDYVNKVADSAETAGVLTGLIGGAAKVAGGLSHVLTPADGWLGGLKKTFSPSSAAVQDMADTTQKLGGIPVMEQNAVPFDNLGIKPTISELMGPNAKNYETGIVANHTNQDAALSKIADDEGILRPKIDTMLNSIVPEGVKQATATKNTLYSTFKDVNVPSDLVDQLKQDPNIANTLQRINKSSMSTVADLPDTSLAKLDVVKQELQSQIYNDTKKLTMDNESNTLTPDEKISINNSLGNLIPSLDAVDKNYAPARQISERLFNRQAIVDQMSKVDPGPNIPIVDPTDSNVLSKLANTYPIDTLYKRLWNTPDKQQVLFNSIENAGGDVDTAKDILSVVNSMRNSPVKQLVGASPQSNMYNSMTGKYNKAGWIEKTIHHFSQGLYNNELAHLLVGGEWQDKVKDVLAAQSSEAGKVGALATFLSGMKQSGVAQGMRSLIHPALQGGLPVAGGVAQGEGIPVRQSIAPGLMIGGKYLGEELHVPFIGKGSE